jgi:hypothetical protein
MFRQPEPHEEAPAVLCVICGTGIETVAEMVVTEEGPAHVRCRPAADAKARVRMSTG